VSISTFLDTQESFQEAKMKDICGVIFEESYVREEVAHTDNWSRIDQLSKQRLDKAIA